MSYATLDDMIGEFGQREMRSIGDPDSTGEIDTVRVDNALTKASEQIDFSVGQRCALPLAVTTSTVGTFLKQLCIDIARYRLTGSSGITVTDEVRDRYREAAAQLERIVQGKIILCEQNGGGTGGGNGLQPEGLTAGEAEFVGSDRVFTRCGLADYIGRLR